MSDEKKTNGKKSEERKNNEQIALMIHKLYEKINDTNLSEKEKQSIKFDITSIRKACGIKSLSNKTISDLKKLGLI